MSSGFTLRARLVFREQRQIFDYWRSRAELRAMPSRRDLDPCAMRAFLPQISLIDISGGMKEATVRLAGSRLREVYGMELTGKCLGDIEWGQRRPYWQNVYNEIVANAAPRAGTVTGPMYSREHVTLYWLRMPLSDDGVHVNKILCHDMALPTVNGEFESRSAPVCALAAAG